MVRLLRWIKSGLSQALVVVGLVVGCMALAVVAAVLWVTDPSWPHKPHGPNGD